MTKCCQPPVRLCTEAQKHCRNDASTHYKPADPVHDERHSFPQCMAAVLTFLSGSSTDATYNLKSLAPPCPGPSQLRQHKAPVLTDETKCRNC